MERTISSCSERGPGMKRFKLVNRFALIGAEISSTFEVEVRTTGCLSMLPIAAVTSPVSPPSRTRREAHRRSGWLSRVPCSRARKAAQRGFTAWSGTMVPWFFPVLETFSDPVESEKSLCLCFIAFSSREPVPTSLENALASYFRSLSMILAALRPLAPQTPPPGWVLAPVR
jgi:hypothetical protein